MHIEVIVQWDRSRTLLIPFKENWSDAHLKQALEDRTQVPAALIHLSLGYREMGNEEFIQKASRNKKINATIGYKPELRLRIVPLSSASFSVAVSPHGYVRWLIEKIEKVTGLKAADQRLYIHSEKLTIYQNLADIPLLHCYCIYLLEPADLVVSVEVNFTVQKVPVRGSGTVKELRDAVEDATAIDCRHQRFVLGERVLSDSDSLRSLELRDTDVLVVESPLGEFLILRSIGKGEVLVTATKAESLESIKSIHDELVEGDSELQFSMNGCELSPCATVSELGVGAIVEYGPLLLTFKTFQAEIISLALFPDVSVAQVKEELARRVKAPSEELMLLQDGVRMNSEDLLSEYPLEVRDTIYIAQPFDQYICLKTFGEVIRVVVPEFSLQISQILEPFYCQNSQMRSETVVLFNGKKVDIDKSFADYGFYVGGMLELFRSNQLLEVDGAEDSYTLGGIETWRELAKWEKKLRKLLAAPTAKLLVRNSTTLTDFDRRLWTKYYYPTRMQVISSDEILVCFALSTGHRVWLPCKQNTPLLYVASRLAERFKTNPEKLVFWYKRSVLSCNLRSVKPGSCVRVTLEQETVLWVKESHEKDKCVQLPNFDVTVGSIQKYCFGESHCQLFYHHVRLDPESLLSAYGCENCCSLRVVRFPHIDCEVAMESSVAAASKVALAVDSCDRAILVRFSGTEVGGAFLSIISEQLGLSTDDFVVICNSQKLLREQNCKIPSGSRMEVLQRTDSAVVFTRPNGYTYWTKLAPLATVDSVRKQLSLLPDEYFYCSGAFLCSNRTFSSYGVTPCSEVETVLCQSFCVNRVSQSPLAIPDFADSIPAFEIKRRIDDGNIELSRLFVNGRQVEDSELVSRDSSLWLLQPKQYCVHAAVRNRDVTVFLSDGSLLRDLVKALASELRTPPRSLFLLFQGQVLTKLHRRLMGIGLPTECTVAVGFYEDESVDILSINREAQITGFKKFSAHQIHRRLREHNLTEANKAEITLFCDDTEKVACYTKGTQSVIRLRSVSGETLTFIISDSTVPALYHYVQGLLGLATAQMEIWWNGEIYRQQELETCGIFRYAKLYFMRNDVSRSDLCVHILHLPYWKRVKCSRLTSFAHIKKFVQRDFPGDIELIVNCQFVDDDDQLTNFTSNKKIRVFVVLPTDTVLTIESASDQWVFPVNSGINVIYVKQKLQRVLSISPSCYVFRSEEKEWIDTDSFSQCPRTMKLQFTLTEMLIYVECDMWKSLFQAKKTDTVLALKNLLAQRLSVAASDLKLFYRDVILIDDQTLEYYRIEPLSRIAISIASDTQLSIAGLLGAPGSISVSSRATSGNVLNSLCLKHGISIESTKLIASVRLEGRWNFSELRRDGFFLFDIHLHGLSADTVIVLVRSPPELAFPLHVELGDSIAEVKKRVERKVQREVQSLVVKGVRLSEGDTVSATGLRMFSVIRLG